jgi:hypothetical protein
MEWLVRWISSSMADHDVRSQFLCQHDGAVGSLRHVENGRSIAPPDTDGPGG